MTIRGATFVHWGQSGAGIGTLLSFGGAYLRVLALPPLSISVPDNRLYKLHRDGEPVEEFGPYEDEDNLVDALIEINRAGQLEWDELTVHVYETDATPLGIGRKYLGSIDGGAVLMMGEVDEDRIRRSR